MKTTIGLEIHAELKTKTKMFCGSLNAPHASSPNTHVCPVCLAHPGTLPVVNQEAVRYVRMVGNAIGGSLATFTEFDRKNYFYPDIPKGYQISQYKYPLVSGGELAGVKITRVHLEEDTARSAHTDVSVVDYNRAGVPLMELVTEPVIHDPETAGKFARELQLLLRTLGVSDANMEKGEMRVEANISVSPSDELGTKVEVKNINSFKAVEASIIYEVARQTALLEKGEKVLHETRGWDENKAQTFSQRTKETAEDYRYFPDPDIAKFEFSGFDEIVPELPAFKRQRYEKLGLPREQIEIIIADASLVKFFDSLTSDTDLTESLAKRSANYLTSDVQALLMDGEGRELDVERTEVFKELMGMLEDSLITSRVAKDLLSEVIFDGLSPKKIAEERGLLQQNSEGDLEGVIAEIVNENPSVVAEYREGKEAVMQFLVGQAMKKTKGSANPGLVVALLQKALKK